MDAIRRAKIEVLIPILEAVQDAVHDLVSKEESRHAWELEGNGAGAKVERRI